MKKSPMQELRKKTENKRKFPSSKTERQEKQPQSENAEPLSPHRAMPPEKFLSGGILLWHLIFLRLFHDEPIILEI